MDIRYLNYIIEISEQRNMTKAAEKLHISQSTLSQYLIKLEKELSAPLFIRNNRDMELTKAGKLYVESAKEIIEIQQNLYRKIMSTKNNCTLTIGVTSNWGLKILSDVVEEFQLYFPSINLEIIEDNISIIIDLINRKKIDFALISTNNTDTIDANNETLFYDEIVLVVPKTHSIFNTIKDNVLSATDLSKYFSKDHFILTKPDTPIRSIGNDILNKNDMTPNIVFEVNSIHETLNLVSENVGIAFFPVSCAVKSDKVNYIHFSQSIYRLNILSTRKNLILRESEKFFIELCKNYKFERFKHL